MGDHADVEVKSGFRLDPPLDEPTDLAHRIAAIDRGLDPTPTTQERLQALQVEPPGRDRGLGRGL